MSPTSLADRLLSIYMDISSARQSLSLILERKDPENSQCQRYHDVIRRVQEQTLKLAAENVAELVQDLKSWEYMQMKDKSPDGAEGWVK